MQPHNPQLRYNSFELKNTRPNDIAETSQARLLVVQMAIRNADAGLLPKLQAAAARQQANTAPRYIPVPDNLELNDQPAPQPAALAPKTPILDNNVVRLDDYRPETAPVQPPAYAETASPVASVTSIAPEASLLNPEDDSPARRAAAQAAIDEIHAETALERQRVGYTYPGDQNVA